MVRVSEESGVRPIADSPFGPVRGRRTGDVDVWKGIRYGAPPVGPDRWRRARLPQPHAEVADAAEFGAVCPQLTVPFLELGTVRQDEDCLFLNIWAPAGAAESGAKLPVLVWVHGGGYVFGAGSQPLYDGAALVRTGIGLDTPVVIVTLNYRMGALGFTDLRGLAGAGAEFDSNCGLSDVVVALEWVQRSISAFGGDPGRVTLFGESAGAGIVTTLLTSPAADGLFSRAIAQSAPATSVYGPARAGAHARLLLHELGLRPDQGLELRRVSAAELARASAALFTAVPQHKPGIIAYGPTLDDDLVPTYPLDAYRAGRSHPVPLLIGTNRNETALFRLIRSSLMPVRPTEVARMFDLIAAEHPELAIPPIERIDRAYAHRRGTSRSMAIMRDLGFRLPTVWLAQAHSLVAPVHLYRFDWAPPLLRASGFGAMHAAELPYVWGNALGQLSNVVGFGGKETSARVGERMRRRWISFATGGDASGGPDTPDWDVYRPDTKSSLVIARDDAVVPGLDDRLLDAWGEEVLTFR